MTAKHSVECWLFYEDDFGHSVLLLHVPMLGDSAGFWQPVTGGIREGETPLHACKREVSEETGQIVEPIEVSAGDHAVAYLPDLEIHKALFYAFVKDKTICTNPAEHDGHKWVSPRRVGPELYWQSNVHTWDIVSRALEAARTSIDKPGETQPRSRDR